MSENDTIRKLRYGFLLAFHSNYGSILYRFGDKAIENCDFSKRYYVTFALCLSVT